MGQPDSYHLAGYPETVAEQREVYLLRLRVTPSLCRDALEQSQDIQAADAAGMRAEPLDGRRWLDLALTLPSQSEDGRQ